MSELIKWLIPSVFVLIFCGCSERAEEVVSPIEPQVEATLKADIEQIFVLQDVEGGVDIDGVLKAFYHLDSIATESDLPRLLKAIKSPRNNFWTRELLSEPTARLGGPAVLEPLLQAYAENTKEGHDNDGFGFHLVKLVTSEPKESGKELKRLLNDSSFKHNELCEWLLEYIKSEEKEFVVPVKYSAGDSFQGMWNYDRRNANLRLTIEFVDVATRLVKATLQSDDLDDTKKAFTGTVGEDGRKLFLEGIAGTGSDCEIVSGYSVRDFLRKSSTLKINLDNYASRKLRGEVENGTNVYFWTKPDW